MHRQQPQNGTAGNNREALNNCFFEGRSHALAGQGPRCPYGLPTPPDDDVANSYCERSDALNGVDKSVTCNPTAALPNARCKQAGGAYTICHATRTPNIDEFVQKNGPGRNYGVTVPNGPDMRFTTLEDFYGETGKRFQAAFGFRNFEATAGSPAAPNSYGVAVDDMVISWKETRLDEDTHTCAGSGECADIEVRSTLVVRCELARGSHGHGQDPVRRRQQQERLQRQRRLHRPRRRSGLRQQRYAGRHGASLTSDAEVAGEIAVLDQIVAGEPGLQGPLPLLRRVQLAGNALRGGLGHGGSGHHGPLRRP